MKKKTKFKPSLNQLKEFTKRKKDHLQVALRESSQAHFKTGVNNIQLIHEALPELDFKDINIQMEFFGHEVSSPFFVSSMTAGHKKGRELNIYLAKVCQKKKWPMGIGSQRLQFLNPKKAEKEWKELREEAPETLFMANIGLSEVITMSPSSIMKLTRAIRASALIIHTNPLQECFQDKSEVKFKGGFKALERLADEAQGFPLVLKETGCGFSKKTLKKLKTLDLSALDVSGLGGTHWGLVEGARSEDKEKTRLAMNFSSWGISTLDSLLYALEVKPHYEIWASGGVRSGLDAAKFLALGARRVGLAQPLMKAAIKGEEVLLSYMEGLEFELRVALFCTGCKDLETFQSKRPWSFLRDLNGRP